MTATSQTVKAVSTDPWVMEEHVELWRLVSFIVCFSVFLINL